MPDGAEGAGPEAGHRPRVAAGFPADVQELLTNLLSQVRRLLRADTAAVLLLDQTGSFLDTVAADGLDQNVRQRARVPVGRGFAGIVATERRPVTIERIDSTNVVNPLLSRQGIRSLLGVPLLDGGHLVGVMHVGTLHPRVFTADDTHVMEGVARRMGHTLRERLEDTERTATAVLQRSLLPQLLPTVPGLDLAARYLPAEGGLGGDWYDVFALPGDRVGLVMGDVAGHGLHAAVVMGRMRSALRAFALEREDPADVLTHLDRLVCHFEVGEFATVLYAVAAAPYDQLTVSSAGHPGPLLITEEGPATFCPIVADLPVGIGGSMVRRSSTLSLPLNSPLLMFTDGLVERRPPGSLRAGLDQLRTALEPGESEMVCRTAIDAMFSNARPEDDAAVLAVRRLPEASSSAA